MNTGQCHNLSQLLTSLTKYQKGVYHLGSKAFSSLPSYIKTVSTNLLDIKMAEIKSGMNKLVLQNCAKSDVKQKLSCNSCVEYQYKLEEFVLELSSVKKIIQLLQEDQNTYSDPTLALLKRDETRM